ncbi:MAG: DUF58 domain-containing protein [Ilumatobacteraceae bacterium]
MTTSHGWAPTIAHVRAATVGLATVSVAALTRRPDLVVIATPLLVIAAWSVLTRPYGTPTVVQRLDHRVLREGEATTWHVIITDQPAGADTVGIALDVPAFLELRPVTGAVAAAVSLPGASGEEPIEISVRSTRWGTRTLGPATVVLSSAWAAFRWAPRPSGPAVIATLPLPATFDARSAPVHADGLVGLDRSPRVGDGGEFAGIRTFQHGDRLRRIHWPRSLRTGELHVTTTWSDQDRLVVLLVDAFSDVGTSEGIDGRASSLDTTVRAAGAIAEHHLRRGDRVALQIIGSRGAGVPAATGTPQLRRILDRLTSIEPGTVGYDDGGRLALQSGSLVIMLSPLVSPKALERANTLARRGISVAVVDTLPPGIVADDDTDPAIGLAWRIRLLERRREVRIVQEIGIPVVQWRGPGSLDEVMRDIHRRARAPRLARR